MSMKKLCNGKIIYLLMVIVAVYVCVIVGVNRRYTEKLANFPVLYFNDEMNYYQEWSDDVKIEIVRVRSLLSHEVVARMILENVYWEENDVYIDIALMVKEDFWGKRIYGINYTSESEQFKFPLGTGDGEYYYAGSIIPYAGQFLVDENMESLYVQYFEEDTESKEYNAFLHENKDALKLLVSEVENYWNLGLSVSE